MRKHCSKHKLMTLICNIKTSLICQSGCHEVSSKPVTYHLVNPHLFLIKPFTSRETAMRAFTSTDALERK